jgi:hypothetical protein
MLSFRHLFLLLFFFSFAACSSAPKKDLLPTFEIPSPAIQKKLVLALRDQMIRLDAEGLLARKYSKVPIWNLKNSTIFVLCNTTSSFLNKLY